MAKTITLRLSDEEYDLYSHAAKAVKRPISNLINYLAQKKLEDDLFADQIEMDEILGNPRLVTALQNGSNDAKQMKGAFVDVSDI
ncbi:MAG: CopG family transcriptional regulator [Deltaproteobacteria bacterium]|nr:CopG family transcriptional regulator [Deltaproteobacteria bacterium]